ncbi:NACHT, LRR and PYD domains-containing protein 3-like [Dysidea avara]|uniref:NACHT, LRR and PYD domains-containing protein 3-like n=1 Tax=Dysidea avara TaxID=196820 RepID=UPI0033198D85
MDRSFISASGNDRPSLGDMYKHVVPSVADKWKGLGVELLDPSVVEGRALEVIDANFPRSVEECCKSMLEKWYTTPDASWNKLIDAIKNINLNSIASQIEGKLKGSSVTEPCQSPLSSHMCKYRQHLCRMYAKLKLTSMYEILDCCSSKYIDLTIKKVNKQNETENKKGSDIVSVSEMLNFEGGENKVILIKGDPGVGKTTLAINICKSWAEGKLLQTYTVILLLLRDPLVQKAEGIGDLLMTLDDEFRKCVAKEITDSDGKNVCFILEGYDELPKEIHQSSIFFKLEEQLPDCAIVYTSRPEACNWLEGVEYQIQGFTETSICDYIANTFKVEDQKMLRTQLVDSHFGAVTGLNILYIPIILAIVCMIFKHKKDVPKTLTELYTLFCLRLILRHISKQHPDNQVTALRSLDRLPNFTQLCSFAYKAIKNKKLVFTSQDLEDTCIADIQNNMGLLVAAPSISEFGIETSYNFIHKTVQEFCAAWHISKALSPEDQLDCINSYWHDNDYRMVWMFYSGITGLSNREILNVMLPYKLMSSWLTSKTVRLLIDCIYETQNPEVCQIVGDHLDGRLIDLSRSWIANSYFLMQYQEIESVYSTTNLSHQMFQNLKTLLDNSNYDKALSFSWSNCTMTLDLIFDLVFTERCPITELTIMGMRFNSANVSNFKADYIQTYHHTILHYYNYPTVATVSK